jgi:hypothetical protein
MGQILVMWKSPLQFMSFIALLLVCILCSACEENAPSIMGPCEHSYLDPIIEITRVSNAKTGQPISAFKITSVEIEGNQIDLHHLIHGESYNSVLYDSTVYCSIPCGFGTQDGEYKLLVSAVGYQDTAIIFNADYKKFEGGCPSSSSGSTTISFEMTKR